MRGGREGVGEKEGVGTPQARLDTSSLWNGSEIDRFHFIIILPNINKLMILADRERMLRVLFVVKSETM